MNNIEYGDKLIFLGNLMKNPNTSLADLVTAALDCGLIYTFGLIPKVEGSIEINLENERLLEK
jgi:hypothetical protein